MTTAECAGTRERVNSPDSKPLEFDGFRNQAEINSFTLTAKRLGANSQGGKKGGGL